MRVSLANKSSFPGKRLPATKQEVKDQEATARRKKEKTLCTLLGGLWRKLTHISQIKATKVEKGITNQMLIQTLPYLIRLTKINTTTQAEEGQ